MTPAEFEDLAELLRVALVPTGGGKAHEDVRARVEEFVGLARAGTARHSAAKLIAKIAWDRRGLSRRLDGEFEAWWHSADTYEMIRGLIYASAPRPRSLSEDYIGDTAIWPTAGTAMDPDGWYTTHTSLNRNQVYHRVAIDSDAPTAAACARHLRLEPASYQPFNAVTPGMQCRRRACQRPTQ